MSRLDDLEKEIRDAEYEAFFYIGQRLLEIRKKRLYEEKGFKSWSAYCSSGRLEFRKSQANDYIAASEIRPSLPKPTGTPVGFWAIRHIVELAKCKTDRDRKRVAKKVIAEAKRLKVPVTSKMIAEIRDAETTKPDEDLKAASLDNHLQRLASLLLKWRYSLEKIDLEQWDSVEHSTLIRVREEADALTKFLRS